MEKSLRPCPFCGGKARVVKKEDRLRGDSFRATCERTNCLGRNYKLWPTAQKAAAA